MKYIKSLWSFIVWIFERSDIIPPLIVVSVWHYAGALAKHDPPVVAGILGVLVDLGHYRAVKSYLRNMTTTRFFVMAIFTLMTGYYHYLWYGDVLLAMGVPLLIIGLALLSRWDKWEEKQAAQFDVKVTKVPEPLQAPQDTPHLTDGAKRKTYACPQCGEEVTNLGNHTRWKHRKDVEVRVE